MYIVFSSLPIYSHLVPVLAPAAGSARAAGHRVAVATAESMANNLADADLPLLALPGVAPLDRLRADPELARRYGLPTEFGPDAAGDIARAFAGPVAGAFAADLIAAVKDDPPDLIVRECNEFGGHLAAAALGVPGATLDIAPFAAVDLPMVIDAVNRERNILGLSDVDELEQVFGIARIGVLPRAWYPDALRCPQGRYYRAPVATGPTRQLDPELAALPADRPLVFAGLGSLAPTLPGFDQVLHTIVAALGELDVSGVVATGSDPADWSGPRPANVLLRSVVPQAELLGCCDLFIGHAGFGGVREAIAGGTPMVALPLFTDQFGNADRLAELGMGIRLDPDNLDAATLASACRKVLAEPEFRWRAAGLRRAALADPSFPQVWRDLAAEGIGR